MTIYYEYKVLFDFFLLLLLRKYTLDVNYSVMPCTRLLTRLVWLFT